MFNTLTEVLSYASAHHGDKVAVHIDGEQFTFRRLDELASQVANGLDELGIGRGDIVTLYSENRWEWIVSYYGVLKLGAVVNPINVMLTPTEVEFVVRDCGAKALLASGEKGGPILGLADGDGAPSIVLFDTASVIGAAIDFAELVARRPTTFESPEVAPTDLASICYTSGTTGHPKGAMQSHQAVLLNAAMTAQVQTRTAVDVAVNALPLPHVYGTVIMNSTMLVGSTLVVHKRFVADDILRDLDKYGATTFDGVPTMYLYLLNHPDLDTTNLSALRKCFVGGQTMPVGR